MICLIDPYYIVDGEGRGRGRGGRGRGERGGRGRGGPRGGDRLDRHSATGKTCAPSITLIADIY